MMSALTAASTWITLKTLRCLIAFTMVSRSSRNSGVSNAAIRSASGASSSTTRSIDVSGHARLGIVAGGNGSRQHVDDACRVEARDKELEYDKFVDHACFSPADADDP